MNLNTSEIISLTLLLISLTSLLISFINYIRYIIIKNKYKDIDQIVSINNNQINPCKYQIYVGRSLNLITHNFGLYLSRSDMYFNKRIKLYKKEYNWILNNMDDISYFKKLKREKSIKKLEKLGL